MSDLVGDKSLRRIVSRRPRPSLAEPLQNDSASALRTSHPRQSAHLSVLNRRCSGMKDSSFLCFLFFTVYWLIDLSSPIAIFVSTYKNEVSRFCFLRITWAA